MSTGRGASDVTEPHQTHEPVAQRVTGAAGLFRHRRFQRLGYRPDRSGSRHPPGYGGRAWPHTCGSSE